MTATLALIVDAYRELNARKLFWITLALSGVVVAAMASVGLSDKGVTFLWFSFPIPIFNATVLNVADFYKMVFLGLGYNIWLTWAATILALISTASIIPDFVASGSIELSLSKPLGRARLFLTKYFTGVLFVALQVGLFSVLSFLVIGLRGGSWEWGLFWAVPIIVLFFSYLYSLSTLIGLLTRSPITSLLVTGVLWFVVFGIHTVETAWFLRSVKSGEVAIPLHEAEIASRETQLAAARAAIEKDAPAERGSPQTPPTTDAAKPAADPWPSVDALLDVQTQRRAVATRLEAEIENYKKSLRTVQEELDTQQRYHAIIFAVKSILPKTSETTDLLQRRLLSGDELERVAQEAETRSRERGGRGGPSSMVGSVRVSERLIGRELDKELRSRSVYWVILTSIAFEAVVLGAACIIFTRKDF